MLNTHISIHSYFHQFVCLFARFQPTLGKKSTTTTQTNCHDIQTHTLTHFQTNTVSSESACVGWGEEEWSNIASSTKWKKERELWVNKRTEAKTNPHGNSLGIGCVLPGEITNDGFSMLFCCCCWFVRVCVYVCIHADDEVKLNRTGEPTLRCANQSHVFREGVRVTEESFVRAAEADETFYIDVLYCAVVAAAVAGRYCCYVAWGAIFTVHGGFPE